MDAPKNPIPVSLQTVLEDLDFLSQIQRDKKPCFKTKVFVDANSWSGAFYRLLKQESRNGIINHVEQIINRAIEAIDNQKYEEHLPLVINGLNNAREGLCNLTFTYNRDPKVKSHINVQLQNMDIQLNRFKHLIRGFTPSEVVAALPPSPSHSTPTLNASANNVSTSISVSVPSSAAASNTEVVVEKRQSAERIPPSHPPAPIPINIELDENQLERRETRDEESSDDTPQLISMESPNYGNGNGNGRQDERKSDGVGSSKSVPQNVPVQPKLDLVTSPTPHNPPMDRRKIRKIRTRK